MRLRMKIPRQPARYRAECSISLQRKACYCFQNFVFCRAVNRMIYSFPVSAKINFISQKVQIRFAGFLSAFRYLEGLFSLLTPRAEICNFIIRLFHIICKNNITAIKRSYFVFRVHQNRPYKCDKNNKKFSLNTNIWCCGTVRTQYIPREAAVGAEQEEFHVDDKKLQKLLIEMFYKLRK